MCIFFVDLISFVLWLRAHVRCKRLTNTQFTLQCIVVFCWVLLLLRVCTCVCFIVLFVFCLQLMSQLGAVVKAFVSLKKAVGHRFDSILLIFRFRRRLCNAH